MRKMKIQNFEKLKFGLDLTMNENDNKEKALSVITKTITALS